ncbi:MAG: hypothetical protein NTY09_07070 [bacterium]|nr:hypothetical protein [bacterium]
MKNVKKIKTPRYFNSLLLPIFLTLIFLPAFTPDKAQASQDSTDVVALTENLMGTVENLRGLEFTGDLPVDLVTAEDMAGIIDGLLDKEITEEDDHNFTSLYVMLGMMPRGSSLRDDYQAMTEEQVAGLYDPAEKRFYVVDVDLSAMLGNMLGEDSGAVGDFLGGLLEGIGGGIGDVMTNSIIVHELTHALDDQHYDLETNMEALQNGNSDDASLAYQSLVEGSATRTMNDYISEEIGLDAENLGEFNSSNMAMAEGLMNYSPFLERLMIVPYLQGEVFVRYILDTGGQDGLTQAFIYPPMSMEQVLHPEKYSPEMDVPSYAPEPDLSHTLNNWSHEATDTLGELFISLMFELLNCDKAQAERIAAGWDYDVVTTWRSNNGDLALSWVSVWDTEEDAREFYDAYSDLIAFKYTAGKWDQQGPSSSVYTMFGYAAGLERSGKVVTIVEGVPENLVQDCLDAARPSNVVYN